MPYPQTRPPFGVGDNTAIQVNEVVDDLKTSFYVSERFTKSNAFVTVPLFRAPYRMLITDARTNVGVATVDTESVVKIGVASDDDRITTITIADVSAVGDEDIGTIANGVVAAGEWVTFSQAASSGAGSYRIQLTHTRLG